MPSPSRSEREEERRLNLRTLIIASMASATAALVTSQLWIAGTWIAAAMTPVLVTLLSELLNRPAERITRGLTTDRPALRGSGRVLPEAAGPAPPAPPDADPLPERAAGEPGDEPRPLPPAPVRVYRSGSATRTRRRKVAYGIVFGTAALAFLIAVVAVTVPELVAGGSIGKRDGGTTFGLGGTSKKPSADKRDQAPQDGTPEKPQTDRKEQQTTPGETETAPEATETAPETETTETAPPPITAPAPAPRQ